jgi:hypothetical protein
METLLTAFFLLLPSHKGTQVMIAPETHSREIVPYFSRLKKALSYLFAPLLFL